jgi:hypothetical protein
MRRYETNTERLNSNIFSPGAQCEIIFVISLKHVKTDLTLSHWTCPHTTTTLVRISVCWPQIIHILPARPHAHNHGWSPILTCGSHRLLTGAPLHAFRSQNDCYQHEQIKLPTQDIDDHGSRWRLPGLDRCAKSGQRLSTTRLPSSAIYREIRTQVRPVGSRCLYRRWLRKLSLMCYDVGRGCVTKANSWRREGGY